MRQAIAIAGLCCALLPAAAAQGLGKQDCRATREVVATAVAARMAGEAADAVKARLSEGEGAVAPVYAATVGPLVDWVFGLDRQALSPDLAAAFEAECLSREE